MDALDAPAAQHSWVACISDGPEPLAFPELSRNARTAGAWLHNHCGPGGTVAALLTGSLDCLAVLFGAFRSGLTLVSLPTPARGMGTEEYVAQVNAMCALTGASCLVTDPVYAEFLGEVTVPVHGFPEYATSHAAPRTDQPGRFVQFTSGSTGTPRGIELSLSAIEANLTSMYHWLPPTEGHVGCSWLPLSHDMGLIGFTLNGICSTAAPWSIPSEIVIIRPETFLSDPARWLQACTDYRATSTAAPPFALRMAMRAMRPGAGTTFDLSSVRSFVVGSEPVSAEGLRQFSQIAAGHGLSPNAICPGYGLAEAALAVAIGDTSTPWTSARVDPDALGARRWTEMEDGGIELVSCGAPLFDVEVRIAGDDAVGPIEVKSPSLLTRYVGDDQSPVSTDGWLKTADLGHLRAGELFIAGRSDDVLLIAGRNLNARALDEVVGGHPACRPGNAACIGDGEGRYVVILEPNQASADIAALREAAREIRVSLLRRFSAGPVDVLFIERGTLPKTPSGKVRRNTLQAQWSAHELAVVATG